MIICLYVNEMLILGSSLNLVNKVKEFLSTKFQMKYMREVGPILGVKFSRSPHGFSLSQAHYVEKVLRKFNSFDVDPARTSYDSSIHLVKNKGDIESQSEYARVIGNIMYLRNCSRPDVPYAISRLSRYTHNLVRSLGCFASFA